ncbi:hypothetical protein DPMN_080798 [Dreissena polymorpha]|uniref:Uncharacterized protein n=1 Tax=Dreissena polymorpha TaxID=45954 RepID=A0A9D4BJJ6_DREPO|nr:hypothetical protein DPMN_080798 [Dreissena polymorpha]
MFPGISGSGNGGCTGPFCMGAGNGGSGGAGRRCGMMGGPRGVRVKYCIGVSSCCYGLPDTKFAIGCQTVTSSSQELQLGEASPWN